MRPVILVLANAVALLSVAPVAFTADAVPKLQGRARRWQGVEETLASCVADDITRSDSSPCAGPGSQTEDKSVCISQTSLDGTPSYVELRGCLEIAADDKARVSANRGVLITTEMLGFFGV